MVYALYRCFRGSLVAGRRLSYFLVSMSRAGAKTVAVRACSKAFVEASEGVLGLGDREEELGVAKARSEGSFCCANH